MDNLRQDYSLELVEEHREVHFRVSGFWDVPSMKAFLEEMNRCAAPLVGGGPFSSFGDMRDGVAQSREVAELIRKHLEASREAGLTRVAVLEPPPLWKMQYQRVSQGLEVQFFDTKAAAIDWLRGSA